jgi:hypothetical protein
MRIQLAGIHGLHCIAAILGCRENRAQAAPNPSRKALRPAFDVIGTSCARVRGPEWWSTVIVPGKPLPIFRERFRDFCSSGCMPPRDRDRDGAIETRVAAFVHLAHAAGTGGGEDLIGAEARAWEEGQTVTRLYGAASQSRLVSTSGLLMANL